MSQQATRPVKEFRAGTIKAAVWRNESEQDDEITVRFSVRIQKRFKRDGEWQDTNYYFPEDLPKLCLVTEKAFEFTTLRESENDSS
ncbi:hypothetical protein ACFL09_00120 [Planctomycetota bacterium]